MSGNETCSPGDFKAHLQGLLPTDSHLPADAFDQIGTRLGLDRAVGRPECGPASTSFHGSSPYSTILTKSCSHRNTIRTLPASPPSPGLWLSVQSIPS